MHKYKYIYSAIAAVAMTLTVASCSEEDFLTFDGTKSGIYIQRVASSTISGTPISFTDSVYLSFASYTQDVQDMKVSIPVCLMGDVKDVDRRFVLKVDPSKTTAIEGKDYEFSDTACYIPAGKSKKTVYVRILRSESIATTPARLVFTLESNENFTAELETYKNQASWSATGKELCGTSFKIIYSDTYTNTTWWDWYGTMFYGDWSVKKEKLVNELMGWTHRDWESWKVPYGQMPYAAKKMKNYLQEAADSGNPVIDDDGSYMQLPAPYSVDYSKYTN